MPVPWDFRTNLNLQQLGLLQNWLRALATAQTANEKLRAAIATIRDVATTDLEFLEKTWIPLTTVRRNAYGRMATLMRETEMLPVAELRTATAVLEVELAVRETNQDLEEANAIPKKAKFRKQRIRCGNRDCHCAKGRGHGPYWYAYWRENGRTVSRYVGRWR